MIFLHRAVAGLTGNPFVRKLTSLPVKLTGVTDEALNFFSTLRPGVQKCVVHRLRVRRGQPVFRLLLMTERAPVGDFFFIIGPHLTHQRNRGQNNQGPVEKYI